MKRSASRFMVFGPDFSAVIPNDVVRYVKPKPRSLALLFCGKEGVKKLCGKLTVKTRTIVGNNYFDVFAVFSPARRYS